MRCVAFLPEKAHAARFAFDADEINVHEPESLSSEIFNGMYGSSAYVSMNEGQEARQAHEGRGAEEKAESEERKKEKSVLWHDLSEKILNFKFLILKQC